MLQNEEVCGNTIYLLERSEWSKSHYSPKPEAEVNNDLFSTRPQPELKTCYYFALMSYITILVAKYCENNSKNYENNIIFLANYGNNSKNCENNVIFTANCEVIRQKTQNNTFYLTCITPSRGNYNTYFCANCHMS